MLRGKTLSVVGLISTVAIVATAAICLLCKRQPDAGTRVFQGKTLATWFDQMQGYNRDPGVQTLREIGSHSIVYLAQQINRKDSFLRRQYVALWPKLPGFLRSILHRPKSAATIRMLAIGTLREMGPALTTSDIGLATLMTALDHPDIEVRSRAEGAIGDIGPQAKGAVQALIRSVERRDLTSTGHIDINGIWALGKVGPDANVAIPVLESIIRQKGGRELVYAAEALIQVGGDRTVALAALERALGDQDQQVRAEAAEALRKARLTSPAATESGLR